MITACLIATIVEGDMSKEDDDDHSEEDGKDDGVEMHDATQFLDGEYKTILQLVTVLSHGKREWTASHVDLQADTTQRPNASRTRSSTRWRVSRTCARPCTTLSSRSRRPRRARSSTRS
jgi:hypothetical protein